MHRTTYSPVLPALILSTGSAHAASLDGAAMSLAWALPFAGLLLTIATGPTLFRKIWHAHYGKIALAWTLLVLVPLGARVRRQRIGRGARRMRCSANT